MKITALIMAGGRGERFWPRSRVTCPKQFLNITDEHRTMIQLTIDRIAPIVKKEDIFILTNELYGELTTRQVCGTASDAHDTFDAHGASDAHGAGGVPKENILFEPVSRNTCPAIALGCMHIQKKYGDALVLVLPSDSDVGDDAVYVETLKKALRVAEVDENLVTVGITPTAPETGYGYINFDKTPQNGYEKGVMRVARYVEKPNLETATRYVQEGTYLWNSGQFIMKCSSFLNALGEFAPDIASPLRTVCDAIGTGAYGSVLAAEFPRCPSISVDYAVMEKSQNLFTIAGNFGWDDVGSWNALNRIKTPDENGNTFSGSVTALDCNNCIIEGKSESSENVRTAESADGAKKKLIAAIGLDDVIVVDTDDVLLLCKRDRAQNIKAVLEKLKTDGKTQYL